MSLSPLKVLAEEKVVTLPELAAAPREHLKGIVRVMDNGDSLGVFLDAELADALLEDIEASSPEFAAKIEESRRSGRVSAEEIEHRLGL
jgi:hypothetical protein